jgi:23S rRNA (uridine2552-2'-O)-methyltransferase
MLSVFALWASLWVVDRVEGQWAVLQHATQAMRLMDVPAARLDASVREGDVVAWPSGRRARPGIEQQRRTRLQARLRKVQALASSPQVVQFPAVKNRSDHRQDHFFHKAKREGFAARSVYKLEEIDKKGQVFRRGQHVLDLGCSPGSWMQYLATTVGPNGRVAGVDLKSVRVNLPGHAKAVVGDAFALSDDEIRSMGAPFDVVTSDMAPATSGNRFTDHVRSIELCRRALEVATRTLKPGGAFVCKVFEGEDAQGFFEDVRRLFKDTRRVKPKSTRTESVELFVVGTGYVPQVVPPDVGGAADEVAL